MYRLIRPLLFALDAETAHHLTLRSLQSLAAGPLRGLVAQDLAASPIELLGLHFRNRIGLAAGLDKNGECIDGLGGLGFGFIELGTVTPRPQDGNPRPRLFRLPEQRALLNRMGFNNLGIAHLVERLRQRRYTGVVGVNIGKNKDTPNQAAVDDYVACLRAAWPVADYLTVNISSPNTPGLRALQSVESLHPLLAAIRAAADREADDSGRRVPVLVKIAPDLTPAEVQAMAAIIQQYCDGAIATNTTSGRAGVEQHRLAGEAGGLSGAPLTDQATAVLAGLRRNLPDGFPLIAAGGVMSAQDALRKLQAGADLVQVYTGLIYRGPGLLRDTAALIAQWQRHHPPGVKGDTAGAAVAS